MTIPDGYEEYIQVEIASGEHALKTWLGLGLALSKHEDIPQSVRALCRETVHRVWEDTPRSSPIYDWLKDLVGQ